ncbi:Vms1/Ankzf1 family peptidyl-tRNA hydrolase [Halomarina salina]|uniref:Vms1/Ankzf1 family peptidyl-tRNA hydrolase n=1 Tax=Halomarina salina TaxID=1872699 RepID=A0ABD5RJH7_9EURY|nr:Vms1/Ankzf1 family peptidyl-tRNA hydrolase [Halomarina salina]
MTTEDTPLHDRIRAVESVSVDEDRLLTVAVPADESVGTYHERIEEADAEVSYIDTNDVSKHERDALERVRRTLAEYDETPENGLVTYAGVVDADLTDWTFDELPDPVRESRTAWGNEFDTEPLDALATPSQSVGLLVVERGGAAFGRLDDGRVEVVETIDRDGRGTSRQSGESTERFERDEDPNLEAFFDEVGETAGRLFVDPSAHERATEDAAAPDPNDEDRAGVDGLLVGGTTGTVERFVEGEFLPTHLADRLLDDAFAVEYANERGLERLADLGEERVGDVERRGPRDALDRLFEAAKTDDEEVVHGHEAVDEALTYDAVETLLLSESLETETYRTLEERATEQGGEVLTVPTDIEGGEQFVEGFDGRGAFLRFPVE